MYRVGGDSQYFPLISALSRLQFGEFCLYESKGEGVLSFPFATLFPFALFYHFFGSLGFVLADIFIALAYYIILSKILELLEIPLFLARAVSLLVVTGVVNYFVSMLSHFILSREYVWLSFWGWRIPSPFVSEVFFLASIYCVLALLFSQNFVSCKRYWFFLGLSTSALLQGDPFSALIVIISIFYFFLPFLIFKKNLRVYIVKGIFLFSLVLIVFSIPFFLQRIFENPDVPRRLGLIPISRTKILLLYGKSTYITLIAILISTLFLLLLLKYFKNIYHTERIKKTVIILFCISLIAFISQPVSIILFGRGIQIWHFHDRFLRISLLTIMVFTLYALNFVYQFLKSDFNKLKIISFPGYIFYNKLIIIILVFICILSMVKDAYVASENNKNIRQESRFIEYGLTNYRNDFVLLINELMKKEYKNCKVIGTFDHQAFCWWVAFNHGYSYVVDPFVAAVPDRTIEFRLINLCKIIGMSGTDFKKFFNLSYVHLFWLSHAKYIASSLYTFSPLSDYDNDEQEMIRTSNVDAVWHQIIPKSEQVRLINRYLNEDIKNDLRLDLVVLTNDESLINFAPSSDRFMLTYKNYTFRVWRQKDQRYGL